MYLICPLRFMGLIGKYRYRWPELLGEDVEKAIRIIKKTNPLVSVVKVPDNAVPACHNFCCNRVCFNFQRRTNKVIAIPQVG